MKFFFGFLALIAAIVVVVLLTLSLFRGLDGSNNSTAPSTSTYDLRSKEAASSVVRFTTSGTIVAEENHREIRITISKSARTVEIISGYNGKVINTSTITNTPAAYDAFLNALYAARYADRTATTNGDPRSTCVTGNRFFYGLQDDSGIKVDTWTTSCSAGQGNFAGNVSGTSSLFRSQIPNYNQFTNGVNLNAI